MTPDNWSERLRTLWPDRATRPRGTSGEYQAARLRWFLENGAKFFPVSGHRTASGKSMWRVWADPIRGAGACELSAKNGNVRLFSTFEAAQKAADELNARALDTRRVA